MWVAAKLTTIGSAALGWDVAELPAAEWARWGRLWDTSPPGAASEATAQPLAGQPRPDRSLVGAKPVPGTVLLPTPSRTQQ